VGSTDHEVPHYFLKDNWMGKNAYYQFRPTAKIDLIRQVFVVKRFNKNKLHLRHVPGKFEITRKNYFRKNDLGNP
jgi:hypothetical protein